MELEEALESIESEEEQSEHTPEFHCVGVCHQGLLCQVLKPPRFILVQWCALSANLCSPFHTHKARLRPVPERAHWYTVETWLETEPRLEEPFENGRVREMLNNTLFLLLDPMGPVWADRTRHFPWDLVRQPLTVRYVMKFDALTQLLETPLAPTPFWKEFRRTYRDCLQPVRETLKMPHQLCYKELAVILERWLNQKHMSGYVCHRLLDMADLFRVARDNDALQVPLGKLDSSRVHDLSVLHRQVSLARRGRLASAAGYADLDRLVRQTLQGKVPALLQHHFTQACPDPQTARRSLVAHVLVPALMCTLETRALESRDTCFPVTLETLAWYCGQMLGFDARRETVKALLPFSHNDDSNQPCDSVTHFTLQQLPEFIAHIRVAKRDLLWQCVLKQDEPVHKLYTPLFVIQCQPEELIRERDLHQRLWQAPDWKRECLLLLPPYSAQWNIQRWRREFEALEDIERSFYDTRLVLVQFTPVEMLQGCDVEAVYQLLVTDFHATAVILPPRGYGWGSHRLEECCRAKMDGLTAEQLRDKTFRRLGDEALRDTLVVMDAHQYSYAEMQSLMQWLEASRQHYSRCVILGAWDTHPLRCVGHAFTDLAQWHDRVAVRQACFDNTQLWVQFRALLQQALPHIHVINGLNRLAGLIEKLASAEPGCLMDLCLIESLVPAPGEKQRFAKESQLRASVTDPACLGRELCQKYQLTVTTVSLDGVANLSSRCTESDRYVFLIERQFLERMQRNELNHLLTETHRLIVLERPDTGCDTELRWLVAQVERQRFPNLRHTLPFLTHL